MVWHKYTALIGIENFRIPCYMVRIIRVGMCPAWGKDESKTECVMATALMFIGFIFLVMAFVRFKRPSKKRTPNDLPITSAKPTFSPSQSFDDKSRSMNDDSLDSGKSQFIATLRITTPFAVLRHHGEIFNGIPNNAPKYGEQGEGYWRSMSKTFKELGINLEEFAITPIFATDIGPQNSDTSLPFLLSFRDIFESKDKDANKIRRFGTLVSSNLEYENFWEQLKAKYQDFPLCLFYNSLLDLPGVGRKTARNLYEAGFCSIDQVKNATQSELQKVSGIGQGLAQKLTTKEEV